MKIFPEWCQNHKEYDKESSIEERFFDQRNAIVLKKFEKRYGAMSRILARSLGRFMSRKKNIDRKTRKFGVINPNYVQEELVRAHSGQELTQKIYDRRNNPKRDSVRHTMAISLLLDQSGSTRFDVDESLRRIDLIKYSALAIGRSLHTLGDSFFISAFHSHQNSNPTYMEILKQEEEPWSTGIESRIAALEHTADGSAFNNKDGAAIRYANERILLQPYRQKYIFLVSDGVPNCDHTYYQGTTAQHDTHKAMREGYAMGIHYVYLTINPDDNADEFMSMIQPTIAFGRRYTRMRDIVEGLTLVYESLRKGKL